jgi:hypothetical protein
MYMMLKLYIVMNLTGTPDYVLNTPLFQHTAIQRGGAHEDAAFHIIAMGAGQDREHSREVFLNSRAVQGPLLSDRDIAAGGLLQFVLEPSAGEREGGGGAGEQAQQVFRLEDLAPRLAAPAPAPPAEDYLSQIEKQKKEIDALEKRLADSEHLSNQHVTGDHHEHHIALEPVVQHHISDTGDIIAPDKVADDGCGHSSTMYTGLVVLSVNLAVVCWMLALQVQKYRNGGGVLEANDAAGTTLLLCQSCCTPLFTFSIGCFHISVIMHTPLNVFTLPACGIVGSNENICQRMCSCISVLPVLLKEGVVSVVGIQTFQSVVSRTNKEKTYTV